MSEVLDYTPRQGGRTVDVASTGGTVSLLQVYPTGTRSGVPLVTASTPVANGDGSWRFTFDPPDQADRYYATVTWTASAAAGPTLDKTLILDLPTRYDLIVSCEQVAVRLGVPLPLTDTQRARIEQEIEQVQADAANYINRAIFPVYDTVTDAVRCPGYPTLDYRSWPRLLDRYDDLVTVQSATQNPDSGSWTLAVMVGLDGRNNTTLTRFVLAGAAETIRNDPAAGMGTRQITSMSADGQSVSWKQPNGRSGAASDPEAGAMPTLSSLNSLRRASVRVSQRPTDPPWPYDGLTGMLSTFRPLY